jgi:hypothetical protein
MGTEDGKSNGEQSTALLEAQPCPICSKDLTPIISNFKLEAQESLFKDWQFEAMDLLPGSSLNERMTIFLY